jgi:ABC-type glycerol-3-phosphate transport system substrate-binding protein
MNRTTALPAGLTAVAVALAMAGCAGTSADDGVVKLTYETLAWQTTSIQANKDIVAEWNEAHPDIQVEYIQGDWGSIGDQLTTSFTGGKAPDVFHYYDTPLQNYAKQGYLLDLSSYLSDDFVKDIRETAWDNVTFPGIDGVWGVPFLQEPTIIIANKALLDAAGIEVPAPDDPWTWDEFQDIAKTLTVDADGDGTPEQYGAAMPLAGGGSSRIIPLGPSFGARYFNDEGTALEWGDAEAEIPTRVHDMLHIDKSMSMDVLGLTPPDLMPAFFDGQYATIMVGSYVRQQVVEGAPEGFEWVAIPTLQGDTREQSNGAQTISISQQTAYPEEATQFLEFLLNPENQARLAAGDWETPTSIGAGEILAAQEGLGWEATLASTVDMVKAGFQSVAGYDEWMSQVGDPAFGDYFAGNITIEQMVDRLKSEGDPILERVANQ